MMVVCEKSWLSTVRQPSLPNSLIENVFQKMEDFYGAKWAAAYGSFPRQRVKATWADVLSGFADSPNSIAFAISASLESVFPPTLPEFLALCRQHAKRGNDALPKLTLVKTSEEMERDAKKAHEMARQVSQKQGFDPMSVWLKPKSRIAVEKLLDGAKTNSQLAGIVRKLKDDGVLSEKGAVLKLCNGSGFVDARKYARC